MLTLTGAGVPGQIHEPAVDGTRDLRTREPANICVQILGLIIPASFMVKTYRPGGDVNSQPDTFPAGRLMVRCRSLTLPWVAFRQWWMEPVMECVTLTPAKEHPLLLLFSSGPKTIGWSFLHWAPSCFLLQVNRWPPPKGHLKLRWVMEGWKVLLSTNLRSLVKAFHSKKFSWMIRCPKFRRLLRYRTGQ